MSCCSKVLFGRIFVGAMTGSILLLEVLKAGATRTQTRATFLVNESDSVWDLELTGSWDIQESIKDDRVSVTGSRLSEDQMHRIYAVEVKTASVPHFTQSLRDNLEAIPDPVDRTRERAMILSNSQQFPGQRLQSHVHF